ncbi:MAG: DUF547 domain-containing protein [Verrucomicrobiota bacterium]
MKLVYALLVTFGILLFGFSTAHATPDWHDSYGDLLSKYVTPQGVKYSQWKANPQDLQALNDISKRLANDPIDTSSPQAAIAYLSNAYNIFVLMGVLDRYPIRSVQEIAPAFGFFSQKRFVLNKTKVSLNQIEKKFLLKQYREPRIHFIINCASISCPALPTSSLTAANLEQMMETSTRRYITSSPEGLAYSPDNPSSAKASQVFDWYSKDFVSYGGIRAFLNRYLESPIPKSTKIGFLKYNWDLNEI